MTQLLSLLPYRDWRGWSVLWLVGMVLNLALPLISDPSLYGIPPMAYRWIVLVNGVILGLAGLFGMSPQKVSPTYTPPKE